MKKLWIKIKMFFGWKPKTKKIAIPINNFASWTDSEKEIATLINIVREENKPLSMIKKIGGIFKSSLNNVPDLIPNKSYRNEARKRCEAQFGKKVISHEQVGISFRALRAKGYSNLAEILAFDYSTPESVVKAWTSSLSHQTIILGTTFKYFGVAQVKYEGKNYYCILFGK